MGHERLLEQAHPARLPLHLPPDSARVHVGVQLVLRIHARAQSAYPSVVATFGSGSTPRDSRDATSRSAAAIEYFPFTRRDLSFIVGFWLIYALLTIANHVFDAGPRGQGHDSTSLSSWIVIVVLEAELWALGRLRAHDRYALQAFDAAAIDYLVKPFD